MKPTIKLCVIGAAIAASSITNASTLNEQKSTIRNEMSITALQNSLFEKKNAGLSLEIINKKLELEKQKVFSQDETIYLDQVSDPIFGENLTEEDKMSFGQNTGYGETKRDGVTAANLNNKDRKNRSSSSELDDEIGGKINLESLEKKIREIVSNEIDINESNAQTQKEAISTNMNTNMNLDLGMEKPIIEQSEIEPSDKGSSTSLLKMEVVKMVKFGKKSKAEVLATFKVVNGHRSKLIEDISLELEEGQIYTYFDKVYVVKTITNKRIVIGNSTDKIDIIQHL